MQIELLTRMRISQMYGVSLPLLRRHVHHGKLVSSGMVGGTAVFTPEAVQEWFDVYGPNIRTLQARAGGNVENAKN